MFETLPPETAAMRGLLADLHDDLPGRVRRWRQLIALELDFGSDRGLILPGGSPGATAYGETRHAFVCGNFLSVVMLSQCVLENVLAGHIELEAISAEVRGMSPTRSKPRPSFRDTVAACRASGLLDDADERDLLRLATLRNALAHFRKMDDPSHVDRRSMTDRRPAEDIYEDDARFAVGLFVRLLSKPAFRFGGDSRETDCD